jgi:hypothetical protein
LNVIGKDKLPWSLACMQAKGIDLYLSHPSMAYASFYSLIINYLKTFFFFFFFTYQKKKKKSEALAIFLQIFIFIFYCSFFFKKNNNIHVYDQENTKRITQGTITFLSLSLYIVRLNTV